MSNYKVQSIQKFVIDQSGAERLILNDIILGREGAQLVAQLIPQYHTNLLHLQIKGNNIDAEGMEMLFMSLMSCPHLQSIHAEWNNMGSSPPGIMALAYLVKNLHFLEFIDLKNNKISHQLAEFIADIIETNSRSLTVLDLRWNQLGEIGAKIIHQAIPYNSYLKFLGLDDNRISTQTLLQINEMLKNTARGNILRPIQTNPILQKHSSSAQHYFPISENAFPSMDAQVKTGQLRAKIDSQQKEAELQQQKLQLEIQKALQKIRTRGAQLHETQLRFDDLSNENVNLLNRLRETQKMLGLEKQRFFGVEKHLNVDKSSIRNGKYQVSNKIQSMMENIMQRNQKEIEDLSLIMSQKMDRLQIYLRDVLNDKRQSRDKLNDIKEDTMKIKLMKESTWDRVTNNVTSSNLNNWEDECLVLQEMITKAEAGMKAEQKKGEYLSGELTNLVMRGLKREEKCQKDIFEHQKKIKDVHRAMTLANVEIEENQCHILLDQYEIIELEAMIDLRRRYIKYVQSQNGVNLDIERLKIDEDAVAERLTDQTIQYRISDLELALKQQLAHNRIIRNQYDTLLVHLEGVAKRTIQLVLFEQ